MSVKVLMTWDIAPDHDQEYFEFVIGEWIPGIQRLGQPDRGLGDPLWQLPPDPGRHARPRPA